MSPADAKEKIKADVREFIWECAPQPTRLTPDEIQYADDLVSVLNLDVLDKIEVLLLIDFRSEKYCGVDPNTVRSNADETWVTFGDVMAFIDNLNLPSS